MMTFPGSPRLYKGGLVLLNPQSNRVERLTVLQYNPLILTPVLQVSLMLINSKQKIDALAYGMATAVYGDITQ